MVPRLRNVVAWIIRNQVPVVSSIESHRPQEVVSGGLPPHCIDGSVGQQKLRFTLLCNRVWVEGDNTLTIPLDLFQRHQQVIFRKRTPDLLGNPKADRLLTQLAAREYLLFGIGLENSVKALALGLRARNRSVTVVFDGCGYWSATAADFALRQMAAKGVLLLTVEQLLTRKLPRLRRYSKLLDALDDSRLLPRLGVYPVTPSIPPAVRDGRSTTSGPVQPPPPS